MTTTLEFSIGTKSTYICDLYLITKETDILQHWHNSCLLNFQVLFGRLLLFVIYSAFVDLSKQSRSMLITESFHFSWIIETFYPPAVNRAQSGLYEAVGHVCWMLVLLQMFRTSSYCTQLIQFIYFKMLWTLMYIKLYQLSTVILITSLKMA